MANERIVVLKSAGPKPEVEFVIGEAQWGSYKLKLQLPDAATWTEVAEGVNWDKVEDVVEVGKAAAQLNGAHLRWTLAITPLQVGDPFHVVVNIKQGGAIVEGGTIIHRGTTLLETHPAAGLVKLVTA